MLVDRMLLEMSKIHDNLISSKPRDMLKEYAQKDGIAIWGTGLAGACAHDYCRKHKIRVTCAVDSFCHEKGSYFHNVPLYGADEFFKKFPNLFVLIACSYTYGIDQVLQSYGYQFNIFDLILWNLMDLKTPYPELINQEKEKIEAVYGLLEDDISKKHFETVIKYRLTMEQTYVKTIHSLPMYFENDVVREFHGNAFVDCGAFTGDTLLDFHQGKHSSCKIYYALEPSQEKFKQLQETIRSQSISYAVPLKIGVWDKRDTLRFCVENDGADYISEEGTAQIDVDSLDDLFHDKEVDFIKMDIEGAERQAILGAKGIIQDRMPIMAFSIYHKAEDLWTLPLLLMEITPNYQLYVRHHSALASETVLYAIPRQ